MKKLSLLSKLRLNLAFTFYKDLFNCKDDLLNNDAIKDFLGYESSQSIPKLSDHQKENMKGSITLEEMTRYLKNLKIMYHQALLAFQMNSINFSEEISNILW